MEKKYYIMFKNSGLYRVTKEDYNRYRKFYAIISTQINSEKVSILIYNVDEPEGFIIVSDL